MTPMLEHRPVRREPRIFLVAKVASRLAYIALDPWDLLGIGYLPRSEPARVTHLRQRIAQVHPTALVALKFREATRQGLSAIARCRRLPVVQLGHAAVRELELQAPALEDALTEYPIARMLDPKLAALLPLAIAALQLALPHRRYAPR